MSSSQIRNFCIIAHIDHGKSTLADRLLEYTGTVAKREMKEQILDQMDLERERGITIKLQPVRMEHQYQNQNYILNLIDTPGHVDFSYEVSRSLAAVEGAVLLVDATQGVQAQTLANLYLAIGQNLEVIPVINKIDLPNADPGRVIKEICHLLGCQEDEVILVSAKTGEGVQKVLEKVIEKVPPPKSELDKPLRALIFDSIFDEYRGVVTYVRLFDGQINKGETMQLVVSGKASEVLEVGYFKPQMKSEEKLMAGEIGYIVTGLKEVAECRVGDTVALGKQSDIKPLPGYQEAKPMVYAGIFCKEGSEYAELRKAVEQLKLNDAALIYEPEHSKVLGFGFRCGFLGMLHLEIFQERLAREYDLDLIVTVPSVAYQIWLTNNSKQTISSPLELPDPAQIKYVEEPWMDVDIITPTDYLGGIMKLLQERKGLPRDSEMEYLDAKRVILYYKMPLSGLIVDFYDKLKNVSSGFASLNYDFAGYEKAEVTRLDILVAEEIVEALSSIVYKDEAYRAGRKVADSLKSILPRQLFEVKIQAAVGGKIIAASRIPPLRKDVTAKLYGGDVTRKRKLLEKQKKGKKRMKAMGKVDIPREAFLAVLKR